jgi:hypothetical protein
MSATIRVTSGTVKVRIDGAIEEVTEPFTYEGVEWDPGVPKDAPDLKERVRREMIEQVSCRAIGSASKGPFDLVSGTVEVAAVDDPVFLLVMQAKTSPHPDETFGQPAPVPVEVYLNPGESYEAAMIEDNAWTILVLTA